MIHTINTTFREAKTINSTTQKTYSSFKMSFLFFFLSLKKGRCRSKPRFFDLHANFFFKMLIFDEKMLKRRKKQIQNEYN